MANTDSQFVSIADAAALLGVSRWTVGRMLDDGEIPHIRPRGVPRIDRADLEAWVAAQKAASVSKPQEKPPVKQPARDSGRPRKVAVAGKAATVAGTL